MGNFDLILDKIGPFGRYQILHWMLCSFAIIPAGIQNLLNVYLQASPEHWCHVPELTNLSVAVQNTLTATPDELADAACRVKDADYVTLRQQYVNNVTTSENVSSVACKEWEYDYGPYGTTAVTQWDLVCSRSTYSAIAQSIYMLGFLLGAFLFGFLSDRYGRKPSLCLSMVGVVVFGVISAFLPEFWSHVFVRMLAGTCAAGVLTVGFVFEMEIIGINKRLGPGLSAQIFFAIGYMLLAGIAYLTREFMWTNFTMSILPIIMFCYWWVMPECPRWLMAQGRNAEAQKEIARMARMNRAKVDMEHLMEEYVSLDTKVLPEEEVKTYTILDLVRTPNMRRKSINICYNWFVTSLVYYGLTMNVTNLAGDPYINLFISGICECASVIVMFLTLDRFGRRPCLAFVLILGGVACIVSGTLPPEYSIVSTVLSMVGKFGVSGSFAIIYVFTAELFPTVVRTIGVGAGSMSARVGGLVAPFVAELRHIWAPLPTLVFGAFAVSAGILSLLFPETLGEKLPESLEEGEEFGRNVKILQCCPSQKGKFQESRNSETDPTDVYIKS